MNHIIKKQVISLQIDRNLDAFRVQQQVSSHYRKDIVPLLQQVFDSLSSEDVVISVDRLEIDLGYLSEKSIERNEWSRELPAVLKRKFDECLFTTKPATGVIRQPGLLNTCQQWIYYISKGYMPWNVIFPGENWYRQVLEGLATDFGSVQSLRFILRSSSRARQRITEQHTVDFINILLEIITARKQPGLADMIGEIFQIISHLNGQIRIPVNEDKIKKDLWSQVLMFSASDVQSDPLAFRLLQSFLHQHKLQQESSADVLSRLPITRSFIESGLDTEFQNPENRSAFETAETGNPEPDDDIFVDNAGLVLLHPFLNRFFHRLSLMDEEQFRDPDCRIKAIYLLHYLATGKTEAFEYELVMPKLLCAWHLHEPVVKNMPLCPEEIREADELLIAVIQHWDILKNTSAEA